MRGQARNVSHGYILHPRPPTNSMLGSWPSRAGPRRARSGRDRIPLLKLPHPSPSGPATSPLSGSWPDGSGPRTTVRKGLCPVANAYPSNPPQPPKTQTGSAPFPKSLPKPHTLPLPVTHTLTPSTWLGDFFAPGCFPKLFHTSRTSD